MRHTHVISLSMLFVTLTGATAGCSDQTPAGSEAHANQAGGVLLDAGPQGNATAADSGTARGGGATFGGGN